ncbi:hypothetical protein HDZ31DRAFT_43983 [Schizophyllum fasciatum]
MASLFARPCEYFAKGQKPRCKYALFTFLHDQLSYHGPVLRKDLSGKTVVVVGANVGLGYETAKHFAKMGAARVVMACRSKERGSAAVQRVQQETGLKNTELMLVDLADFSSTRQFAADLEARLEHLDILVLNAGMLPTSTKREATVDGWEASIQVNVVAPSILALLLLPLMVRTSRERHTLPRLVIVSSAGHYLVPPWSKDVFDQPEILKALSDQEEFEILQRYQASKCTAVSPSLRLPVTYDLSLVYTVLFPRALNERLRATHPTVIVNAVDPGMCATTINRDTPSLGIRIAYAVFSVSAEVGSREIVRAALGGSERAESLRGAYISRGVVREPADLVLSEQGRIAQDRIWREIVAIGKKVEPRIGEIVKEYLLDV